MITDEAMNHGGTEKMMKEKSGEYRGFYEDLVEQVQSYEGERKEIVRLAPELFRLMTKLLEDDRTPREAKPFVNAACAYFVAPYDAIPEEVFGPLGFMDDIFVCLFAVNRLMDVMDRKLLDENWGGSESLQSTIDQFYPTVEKYVSDAKEHILSFVGLEET